MPSRFTNKDSGVNEKHDNERCKYNLLCLYIYRCIRPLTNDLWVFLFQTIDAEYEPVRVEHMCMSKLL